MGSDATSGDMRAFLVPWPFSTGSIWAAQSSFTQQGSRAGTPNPAGDYGLGLQASGSQSEEVTVQTIRGGRVGSGEFVWKKSGDYFGRWADNVTATFETLQETTNSAYDYDVLDSITGVDGKIYVLSRVDTAAFQGLRVYTRSPVDGSLSIVAIYTGATNLDKIFGGLCELPNGDILAAHWVFDAGATSAQLQVSRSTDEGGSWSVISSNAFPAAIDTGGAFGAGASGYQLDKIRMRAVSGQLAFVAQFYHHNTSLTHNEQIAQYVSIDEGTSFELVKLSATSARYSQPEILVRDGQFFIIYCNDVNDVQMVKLPTAWTDIATAISWGSTYQFTVQNSITVGVAQPNYLETPFSAWETPGGEFYICFRDYGAVNGRWFIMSAGTGTSWKLYGNNVSSTTSQFYYPDNVNITLKNVCGCAQGGGHGLFFNWDSTLNTYEGSLGVLWLGGWSSVSFPKIVDYPDFFQYGYWGFTWLGFDIPGNYGGVTNVGGGAETQSASYIETTSTAGNPRYYNYAIASNAQVPTQGIMVKTRLEVISGGDLANTERGVQLALSSGSGLDYRVHVNVSTNKIKVIDIQSGTSLAEVTVGSNKNIELLIGLKTTKVSVWYRIYGEGEKLWTSVVSGGTITAGGGSTSYLYWGNVVAPSGGSVVTRWHDLFVTQVAVEDHLSAGQSNPSGLQGLKYPALGLYSALGMGLSLTSYDGPAREGDSYVIPVGYDYPIDSIFRSVSPSPRVQWRSVAVGSGPVAENFIALQLDTTIAGADDTDLGGDLVALHMSGINFREFRFERYDVGSASWVVLATVSNSLGSFTFARDGASVRSTGGSGPYLALHELAGGSISLDDGAGNDVVRTIRSNSEGVLSTASTKKAHVHLADVAATDPTSGTAHIIPDQCTVIVDLQGAKGAAFGIRITSQKTNTNDFRIGSMLCGRVIVPGRQYSRGRSLVFSAGVESFDQPDGVQRSRVLYSGRRKVSFAWSDGVFTGLLQADPADPDYLKATTGGNPIAALDDVPDMVEGMARLLEGSSGALVYIPRLFQQVSTSWVFNRRKQHILCSIQGDISQDSMVGNENIDEVLRVGSVDLLEIV